MGDYISREIVLRRFEDIKHAAPRLSDKVFLDGVMAVIDNIEAADVAPVVHARWGDYEAFALVPSMNGYPCGNCGMHFSASAVPVLKYCPNCGAKMDKEGK